MFTRVYLCLHLFSYDYPCLLMFTSIYHVFICDPPHEKAQNEIIQYGVEKSTYEYFVENQFFLHKAIIAFISYLLIPNL